LLCVVVVCRSRSLLKSGCFENARGFLTSKLLKSNETNRI